MAEKRRTEFESDYADSTYSNQRLAGGVYMPTKGAGLDWFAAAVDMLASVDDRLAALQSLLVYKDSGDDELEFSVKPGTFVHNGVVVSFGGATGQGLTDGTDNYVYLTADGTLTVTTAGWPDAPHVRLAVITPAGGSFNDPAHIVPWRAAGLFQTTCSTPQLSVEFAVGPESSDIIEVTLQVKDAAGADKGGTFDLLLWLADTQGSLDLTGTACTSWSATTGALNDSRLTTKKEAWVQTDSTGQAVIEIEYTGGAKTWYLEAMVQSIHNSSPVIAFAA